MHGLSNNFINSPHPQLIELYQLSIHIHIQGQETALAMVLKAFDANMEKYNYQYMTRQFIRVHDNVDSN